MSLILYDVFNLLKDSIKIATCSILLKIYKNLVNALKIFFMRLKIPDLILEDDTEVHSDVISQETTTNDSNSDLNSESNQISEGTQVNGNDDENNNVEEPTDKNDVSITNEVSANIEYSTHVEDIGWQPYVQEGKMAGTSGESKRLESIKIRLINSNVEGSISYATHIQNLGWTDFVENDTISGTVGQKLRLEAIKIKLNGEIANYYDVYYRVHVQNIGWLDWACNGMAAGTASYSYRLEGIEIRLVKKGEAAPGPTNKTFISPGKIYYSSHVQDTGWQKNVGDGKLSGTEAESKRIEAIKIYLDNAEYAGNVEYDISVQNIGWQGYKNNGEVAGTIGQKKHVEAVKIRITGEIATYYDVYYNKLTKRLLAGPSDMSLGINIVAVEGEFLYALVFPEYISDNNVLYEQVKKYFVKGIDSNPILIKFKLDEN